MPMVNRIKTERKQVLVYSPWDKGKTHVGPASETHHTVMDIDGIESQTIQHEKLLICGCLAQIAGECLDCRGLVCQQCFVRCFSCGKPLGPCCARTEQEGERLRTYCHTCHSALRRRKLVHLFLSAFIEFE